MGVGVVSEGGGVGRESCSTAGSGQLVELAFLEFVAGEGGGVELGLGGDVGGCPLGVLLGGVLKEFGVVREVKRAVGTGAGDGAEDVEAVGLGHDIFPQGFVEGEVVAVDPELLHKVDGDLRGAGGGDVFAKSEQVQPGLLREVGVFGVVGAPGSEGDGGEVGLAVLFADLVAEPLEAALGAGVDDAGEFVVETMEDLGHGKEGRPFFLGGEEEDAAEEVVIGGGQQRLSCLVGERKKKGREERLARLFSCFT